MSNSPRDPAQLLAQLEAARNRFEPGAAALVTQPLTQLSKLQISDPHQLVRFHECLLFLRAFPHSPSLVARVEQLLNVFHLRIEKFRAANADMSVFDDFDTAGIAGTTMQDVLSFDVAQWPVRQIPRNIEIAWDDYWDDYQGERARGNTWPRFIPLLEEDTYAEANIPWKAWLDAARGRQNPLPWLLRQFQNLPLSNHEQAELYDSLRLPVRWNLENLKVSRTRNWARPRRFYFHDTPLIQRSEVSLAREPSQPAPKLKKLSRAAGEKVLQAVREVMFVRYRELYGTTLGDPHTVVRADVGRGVVLHLWGLPPTRRLPLRAYLCGYTLKNGVPIHYFEAIGLCEWLEVGFNVFYTYRQGETAWIYAQTLRCIRALTAATCISIYPYQIGQDNDEAIDSGAFWFYRKLGFRSGRPDLQKVCEREEEKIAANPQYRTPRRTLMRLAEAPMFYELGESAAAQSGPGLWDKFSVRNLGLLVNRRMSSEFDGDNRRLRQASAAAVVRALGIKSIATGWTPAEKRALEDWSLVLVLIPGVARWTTDEKEQLVTIIRAKAATDEMLYLRRTQQHPRLRAELLRLGSKPGKLGSVAMDSLK
jgi:hypothetical protein